MSIAVFVFVIIAITVVLTLIAIGYFLLYTNVINKALVTRGRKHLHMIPPYKVVISLLIVLIIGAVVLGLIYLPSANRMTSAHDIEKNLREFQAVNDGWNVEVAMSDNIAAALAYDDELTDYTFAIYRSSNDTFKNYEYRYGGHTASVEQSVSVYKYDGTLVLLSMNALHIAKIERHDGESYEIDPNSPFILVIPSGGFDVYDSDGDLIDLEQDWWYEMRQAD